MQNLLEELRDYCEQVENIKDDAQELTAVLDDGQFNWRPSPKQWSIAQCLTHLNLINGEGLDQMAAAIDQARGAGLTAAGPFRHSYLNRKFISMVEPPPGLRVKAPRPYVPPPADRPKEQVVPEFLKMHDRLLDLIQKSNGLDLARIKVPAPIPYLKFGLGARFALLTAHDRRHLHQAWAVRRHRDFPEKTR